MRAVSAAAHLRAAASVRLARVERHLQVASGRPSRRPVRPGAGEGGEWWPEPKGRIDFAAQRARARIVARRYRAHWPEVERFCFFVGYPRSGHSLVGSLLTAHRDVVISHELNALRYLKRGFSREELFALIVERDAMFGRLGRSWTGYSYTVPGQYQGSFERLRLIGDKRGGKTSMMLSRRPELLDRLRHLVAVPVVAVHITRNPYDNIATMARRSQIPLPKAIRRYRAMVESVTALRARLRDDEIIDVAYEDVAQDPTTALGGLCRRLGVDPDPGYLAAAAALVRPPKPTRDALPWSDGDLEAVAALVAAHPVLARYGPG